MTGRPTLTLPFCGLDFGGHYKPDRVLRRLELAHENIKKISRGNEKDDNVFVSMDLSWQKLNSEQKQMLIHCNTKILKLVVSNFSCVIVQGI